MASFKPSSIVKLSGVICILLLLSISDPQQKDAEIPQISRNINSFTLDLLKQHAKSGNLSENVILSPQSLYHGMAASYIASGTETRKELQKVFYFQEDNEQIVEGLTKLREQIHKTSEHSKIDAVIANSMWIDQTYAQFRKEYIKIIKEGFDASIYGIKFQQKKAAADKLNKWISEKTNGKIKNSLKPEDFNSESSPGVIDEPALTNVNCIYFKSDWGSRFDKDSTKNRTFNISKSKTVETPIMHQNSLLNYSENTKLKFLEIPYIDNHYSMYVILPKGNISISKLLDSITLNEIDDLHKKTFTYQVDVLLPKFELKSRLQAKKTLSNMGASSAFNKLTADFDKMIIKKPQAYRIYINDIHQDCWIKVNEEGSEAAVATSTRSFSIGCSSAQSAPPATFHADHPFLFMIVHNKSRSILFSGWISNPKKLASRDEK